MKATKKKSVLLIIPGVPYPPTDGHKLKIYELIKMLNKKFDLSLVILTNKNLSIDEVRFVNEYSINAKIFYFHKIYFVLNLFKSLILGIPFQVGYFSFCKVRRFLKCRSKQYDFVFFNLIRTCSYIDIFKNSIVVLDLVDSIGINYMRSRKKTTSFLFKFIYNIETKRLLKYEKKCIKSSNLTLCVNNDEAKYLSKYGNVEWIPNGVKEELFSYSMKKENDFPSVGFLGAMFYQPNIDAVKWFAKNVFPYLPLGTKFYIIGGKPAESVLKLQKENPNIIVTGFVEDPYLILNSVDCVVAPMQTGGGIQNKILEAMALGQIVVTTSIGAKPIVHVVDGKHLIVEDEPLKMADSISKIIQTKYLYEQIGLNAKELILKYYSWQDYETKLMTKLI